MERKHEHHDTFDSFMKIEGETNVLANMSASTRRPGEFAIYLITKDRDGKVHFSPNLELEDIWPLLRSVYA